MSYHDVTDNMYVNTYINIEENSDKEKLEECVICLEISKKNNIFFECTRYHHICNKCINVYKEKFSNFTCPICRAKPMYRSCFRFSIEKLWAFLLSIATRLKISRRL